MKKVENRKKTKGLDSIFGHFRYFRDNSRTCWRIKKITSPLHSWERDLSFDILFVTIGPIFNIAKNRRNEISIFGFVYISGIRGGQSLVVIFGSMVSTSLIWHQHCHIEGFIFILEDFLTLQNCQIFIENHRKIRKSYNILEKLE